MSSLFYGLTNGGATCWLNATYQSLISLEPLMELLSRKLRAIEPERLMFADYINNRLVAKFFGGSSSSIVSTTPITNNANELRAGSPTYELFIRMISIIDALSNPESFYNSSLIRDLFAARCALPLATCALMSSAISTSNMSSSDSALRLFGALVIYCAATGARPVPEYHTIGEVGPAMLETIIGALCWEHGNARSAHNASHYAPHTNESEEIRAIFRIRDRTQCFCFDHANTFIEHNAPLFDQESAQNRICIQVVPPCTNASTFVSSAQVSVDICEKFCGSRGSRDLCGIPSILNVEYHETFGPVLVIMTDDSVARGLVQSTSTSVYRRSESAYIPREITLLNTYTSALASAERQEYTLATYHLVAQIIQEGGHFTATVARRANGAWQYAYASDRSVSLLSDMSAMSGASALFYVRIREEQFAIHDPRATRTNQIISHAIRESMRGYVNLNKNINVISMGGRNASQPLCTPQSISSFAFVQRNDREMVADASASASAIPIFREFYFAAMNVHITLSLRTNVAQSGLETLWAHKIGAHHGSLIAQAILLVKQTNHKFEPDDFAIWRFCIDPAIRKILREDASSKLRAELDRRMRTYAGPGAGPLIGLAAHSCVIAHPNRDILIERINAYIPRGDTYLRQRYY